MALTKMRARSADPRSGDLRHLREQGLIEMVRVPGSREYAAALTKEGRSLLEHHRDRDHGDRQTFWRAVKRERELEHDLQVYRAYERAAERLAERDARIERVILDHELKREYQKWLHERDRDRPDYDGHPDRTDDEIREWAREHNLPYFDDEVHFPDLRVEYPRSRRALGPRRCRGHDGALPRWPRGERGAVGLLVLPRIQPPHWWAWRRQSGGGGRHGGLAEEICD